MSAPLEKINKLSLPATILIASIVLGGFYFITQTSKQNSIEKQHQIEIEQEKQEKLAKQQIKEEAENALNTCINKAEENYHGMWHRECKAQGKLTNKCIDINELNYSEYIEKYELTTAEYVEQRNLTPEDPDSPLSVSFSAIRDYFERRNEECSCRLLTSTADRFNENLETGKAECFKRDIRNKKFV